MYNEREQLNWFIESVATGNPDGLEGIYAIAGKRMIAVALSILRERADAEDAVQDSFIKIAKFAHRYKKDNPWQWLLKIVRNTALDYIKKRKSHKTVSVDNLFNLTSFDYSPEKRENAIVMENALLKLDEKQRLFIYYRYWLDMSVREIASETGTSKSAVQRAIANAEEKLKKLLNKGQNSK